MIRQITEKVDTGVEVVAQSKPVLYNVNYQIDDVEVKNISDAMALGKNKTSKGIRKAEGKRSRHRNRFNKKTSYIERANREAMKEVRKPRKNYYFKKVNRHLSSYQDR